MHNLFYLLFPLFLPCLIILFSFFLCSYTNFCVLLIRGVLFSSLWFPFLFMRFSESSFFSFFFLPLFGLYIYFGLMLPPPPPPPPLLAILYTLYAIYDDHVWGTDVCWRLPPISSLPLFMLSRIVSCVSTVLLLPPPYMHNYSP